MSGNCIKFAPVLCLLELGLQRRRLHLELLGLLVGLDHQLHVLPGHALLPPQQRVLLRLRPPDRRRQPPHPLLQLPVRRLQRRPLPLRLLEPQPALLRLPLRGLPRLEADSLVQRLHPPVERADLLLEGLPLALPPLLLVAQPLRLRKQLLVGPDDRLVLRPELALSLDGGGELAGDFLVQGDQLLALLVELVLLGRQNSVGEEDLVRLRAHSVLIPSVAKKNKLSSRSCI